MILQIIVSVLILAILVKLILDLKNGRISAKRFYLWTLVWIALAVIVFFPELIIFLAKAIGIERPQDLPIYVSIIVLFYVIFKIGMKIERVEQEITMLVKRLALKDRK